MRLDSVSVHNFLSHKDTTLTFTGSHIQIAGLNGSGKTSAVVDAPLWALYGQARGGTTDQLKGPWDTKMRVVVTFFVNGKSYTLTRERGSSSGLELFCDTDGVDMTEKHIAMTQEKLIQLLGSENAFTNTVIFKQGDGLRFAVMTPSERMALINELVGIEEFAAVESVANKKSKSAESERSRLENEINRLTQAKVESVSIRAALKDSEQRLAILKKQQVEVQEVVTSAEAELRAVQAAHTQRSTLEGVARQAEIEKLRMESTIDAHKQSVNKLAEELRQIANGKPCPTCGSELDPSHPHIRVQIELLTSRLEGMKAKLRLHEESLPALEESFKRAQSLVGKADAQIKQRYEEAEKLKSKASSQLATITMQITTEQREFDQTQGRVTVLERDLDKLDDFQKSHDEQSMRVRAYGLISEAFSKRGIPRELKRGFIAEVERHANAIVSSLGDFTIRLSLEKEGKERNGVTEGTLDVWVRDVAGERKLEMFSGGEKQRLSVALRLAMATAMAKRTDRSLKTLIIDEALDFLDQAGKDAVLMMIGSLSGFERMLFITHDSSIAGLFPDRVEFAKSMLDGSSLIL